MLQPPYLVVLLREEGVGATFCAPVIGSGPEPVTGDVVPLTIHEWEVADGEHFSGVVVKTEQGVSAQGGSAHGG